MNQDKNYYLYAFALGVPGRMLFDKLSYSHFEILADMDDGLKRFFYEMECVKGVWSIRELKRQAGSLYFERSRLSKDPLALSKITGKRIRPEKPADIIKNVYAFDFLEIGHKEAVEESDLESALLDKLQNFILELGNGFCFEARQKRILIGDSYYFIDLAFYHRILKCHVLIELKVGTFEHGDIGQLNTYLNYFKEEVSEKEDNPPVGLLLVAEKDHALAKYATAGLDQNLFVQQYLLKLPDTDTLQKHIENEISKLRQ